jgi:hypothetical protein
MFIYIYIYINIYIYIYIYIYIGTVDDYNRLLYILEDNASDFTLSKKTVKASKGTKTGATGKYIYACI